MTGKRACVLTDRKHHSKDVVEVWHGRTTPAIACGFHAQYFTESVVRAHNTLTEVSA